jgi:hypothetical protein
LTAQSIVSRRSTDLTPKEASVATYRPSFKGLGELLKSPEMVAEMVAAAERAKAFAEAIAPRETGEYASRFSVAATRDGGSKHDRAAAYLINDDPASLSIEYGTGEPNGSRTPKHRTLGRAIDAMRL